MVHSRANLPGTIFASLPTTLKRPKTFQRLHFLIPEVSDLFSTKMLSGPSAETKRAFAIFFVVFLWPKSNDDDDGSMLINTELNHVFTTSKWQLMLFFFKTAHIDCSTIYYSTDLSTGKNF